MTGFTSTGFHNMPATLDPDAAAVFKAFQEAGRPPYETLTPSEARAFYLAGRPVTNPEPPELAKVRELSIPAPHGAIPLAPLHAEATAKGGRPFAVPGVLSWWRLGDRRSGFLRRGVPQARLRR
jgi:hypothetical protein